MLPPSDPAVQEPTYRGPKPTIPDFVTKDPSEFTRLKIALDNLLPPNITELFKYQILMDHLKLEEARLVADSFLNSPFPYSDTMAALNERYGQPHKLALKKIAQVMDSSDVRRGDTEAFERLPLQIRALVGMLNTLGPQGEAELRCGSHVERLLSNLPAEMRSEFRRRMGHHPRTVYTLVDLSEWLHYEAWCQSSESQTSSKQQQRQGQRQAHSTTILHGTNEVAENQITAAASPKPTQSATKQSVFKAFCPYGNKDDHYLSQCTTFKAFNKDQMSDWIQTNHRCWRCARTHQAAQCTLKKPCSICKGRHLQILHEVNSKSSSNRGDSCLLSSTTVAT